MVYGQKATTLLNLDAKIPGCIPPMLAISDEEVKAILTGCGLKIEVLWARVVDAQRKGDRHLSSDAKEALKHIREEILALASYSVFSETFRQLPSWVLTRANEGKQIVIRSSSDEDQDSNANPGGNVSVSCVDCNQRDVAMAIGKVIASYFSEDSISQRLAVNPENTLDRLPLFSFFMQEMIKEEMGKQCSSGVVYTREAEGKTEGLMLIQAAYGHGEGVVENKVAMDSYFVDSEGKIDASIMVKSHRLSPSQVESQSLVLQENKGIYQPGLPVLTNEQIMELRSVCRTIAGIYKKPMDIEWVLLNDKIYIVQARPVPERALKPGMCVAPSSIKVGDRDLIISTGKPVVVCFGQAIDIQAEEEVVVAPTLVQAYRQYIEKVTGKALVKVIIVEKNADSTSHAAGFFRQLGIPVVMIDRLASVSVAVKRQLPLSIDVQNGRVLSGALAQHDVIEGWVKHPVSLPVSMMPRPEMRVRISQAREQARLGLVATGGFFGRLTNKLRPIPVVMESLKYTDSVAELEKLIAVISQWVDSRSHLAASLRAEEDILFENFIASAKVLADVIGQENPIPQQPSAQRLYAIRQLEVCLFQRNARDFVHVTSFATIIESSRWEQDLKIQMERLASDMNLPLSDISPSNQEYALQLLKIGRLFLQGEIGKKWMEFVIRLSAAPKRVSQQKYDIEYLAEMIFELQQSGVLEFYVNKTVASLLQQESDTGSLVSLPADDEHSTNKLLIKLLSDYNQNIRRGFHELSDIRRVINTWVSKIEDWSSVDNFLQLSAAFERDYFPMMDQLLHIITKKEISDVVKQAAAKAIHEAISVYDLSLKSISGSSSYPSLDRAKNFSTLLEKYLTFSISFAKQVMQLYQGMEEKLMWVGEVKGEGEIPDKYAWGIDRYTQQLMRIYESNREKLGSDPATSVALMHASESFDVSVAVIGSKNDCNLYMGDSYRARRHSLSFEDIFTLAHQNILKMTSIYNDQHGISLDVLPKEIQDFFRALQDSSAFLLSRIMEYPYMIVEFNLPMRQHSGAVIVTFNRMVMPVVAEVEIKFFMTDEGNRRRNFVDLANIGCQINGFQMISKPTDLCDYHGAAVREQKFIFRAGLDSGCADRAIDLLNILKNASMAPSHVDVDAVEAIPDVGLVDYGLMYAEKLITVSVGRDFKKGGFQDTIDLICSVVRRLKVLVDEGHPKALGIVEETGGSFERFVYETMRILEIVRPPRRHESQDDEAYKLYAQRFTNGKKNIIEGLQSICQGRSSKLLDLLQSTFSTSSVSGYSKR